MMRLFLSAAVAAAGIVGCATTSKPVAAKLAAEPSSADIQTIKTVVRKAMGRNDLSLEPANLAYSSDIIVRPVAVEGMTDRVQGVPTRLTLMMDTTGCWLSSEDGMRIDMPNMACRAAT